MSFGQRIANRILLAYLAPLTVMFLFGILFTYYTGHRAHLGQFAVGLALILLAAAVFGRIFTRRYALRFAQLWRAAGRIERGDYAARLPGSRDRDEFADLARAFNHMADVIASRETALREQNQILTGLHQRTESVLNATNDGIAMLDRGGCFVLVNRRFCELLGARAEDLLHQPVSEVQPLLLERLARPEFPVSPFASLIADDLRAPMGVAEEIIELAASPESRFLQVYTAPVQGEVGGEVIGRIIALRDITRERELDKMKTDFISVVSHELRTPLTSIKGYTDLLLEGAGGDMTELQSEFLSIIQASTTRLANLINDILDISRIESGKIEIKHEPIDYRKIVADTLCLMKAAADEKQIVMDASLPHSIPPVRGDTDKVTQVLTNLVSNAIKYTPPGGWIKVLLEVMGDASVTTCVADSGIGIAPDDQKKLFQKFFRADNTSTREQGGTGLGLVIAKSIVELLGGAIWVESEAGKGSRFYYTLPLSLETEQGLQSAPEPVILPERGIGLVMVVDDDPYVRGLIQHHLHRRGYGTLVAENGAEALQKARQHKPDAITLDIMMSDMDGFAVLRALKQDPATANIPIIILSVVGDPSHGQLSLGAFSFLHKPLDADRLTETIAVAMVSARGNLPSGTHKEWASVLVVDLSSDSESGKEIAATVSKLAEQGIATKSVRTLDEAIASTITEAPDLILIDVTMPEAELFKLIAALKAEEEAARIPIVLLMDDISEESIHFHLGSDVADSAASMEYICEQISRTLPAKAGVRLINA